MMDARVKVSTAGLVKFSAEQEVKVTVGALANSDVLISGIKRKISCTCDYLRRCRQQELD